MSAEKEGFLTNWKAVYGEHHPYRDPDAMPIHDPVLALGILLMREISLLRKELELVRKTRIIEPAFAYEGYEPQTNVRSKGRAEVEG